MTSYFLLKNAMIENCKTTEQKKECFQYAENIEDKHRNENNFELVNPLEFMRNAYNYSVKFK